MVDWTYINHGDFFSGRSKPNHPPQRINGSTQVISASELRRIRDAIGVTEVIVG